jgi:hypothetical protein
MEKERYIVSWIKWDRTNPQWKPIYKFAMCASESKALKLKENLLKQTRFIEVYVSKII